MHTCDDAIIQLHSLHYQCINPSHQSEGDEYTTRRPGTELFGYYTRINHTKAVVQNYLDIILYQLGNDSEKDIVKSRWR